MKGREPGAAEPQPNVKRKTYDQKFKMFLLKSYFLITEYTENAGKVLLEWFS